MKQFFVALATFLTLASTVEAQTYPRSTTLSAAMTASARTATLASGTGAEAGGALWIDSEFIPIASCANAACTLVNINRTNKPVAHANGAIVTVVSAAAKPSTMLSNVAVSRVGQCSTSTSAIAATALANFQYLPIFDIETGYVYMCRHNGPVVSNLATWIWNATNALPINGTAGSIWTAWP